MEDGFRAFWRYGPPEKPEMVTGMDFVIWDGERARVLYAFVNTPTDSSPPSSSATNVDHDFAIAIRAVIFEIGRGDID
jgi:hypothetical protein